MKEWAAALRPVAATLLPGLANVVAGSRDGAEQQILAELYGEFAADQTDGFVPLEALLAETADESTARVALARLLAGAAAALAVANRWERVRPLLRHSSDDTLRNFLIQRLGQSGIEPSKIVEPLFQSQPQADASVRQALVLVLGDFTGDQLPASRRARLVPRLLGLYAEAADPGTQAAVQWLLRQWGHAAALASPNNGFTHPAMVTIAPGDLEFLDHLGDSQTIRVGRRFDIGAHEVTIAEFRHFQPDYVWDKRSGTSEDCPANEVTWYDAAAYCNWLTLNTGLSSDDCCYAPNDQGSTPPG
jgi:hypothetical protein